MIEKIMRSLTDRDYKSLAKYFTEDCKFFDYCPSLNELSNFYLYGNDCVEMFFKKLFVSREIEFAEVIIENETSANFFVSYAGPYTYARLSIEEYDDSGLVKRAIVHPI